MFSPECLFVLFIIFLKIMQQIWGCGLSMSAASTRVFRVLPRATTFLIQSDPYKSALIIKRDYLQ